MKTQLLVFVVILFPIFFLSEMLIAQAPDTLWTKTFGDTLDGCFKSKVGISLLMIVGFGVNVNYCCSSIWYTRTIDMEHRFS